MTFRLTADPLRGPGLSGPDGLASGDARGDAGARLTTLDAARGIAIVFIVLLHSADWLYNGRFQVDTWIQVNGVLSGWRMPVFFVVSGLLGSRWRTASLPRLFSRKVVPLLWLYFLWQPIGTLVGPFASALKGEQSHPLTMLASLLLTPVRPRLELWYLWALAVSFLLAHITAKVPLRLQLLISGIVSAVCLSRLSPTENPAWAGLPSFYVFFLVGYHYRDRLLALIERLRRNALLAILLIAAWFAAALISSAFDMDRWAGPGLAVHLLGAASILAAAALLTRSHTLQYLGTRTLPIYLAHTPLIILLVWALQPLQDHGLIIALSPVLPLLLTVVTVPLTLALHAALQRTRGRVLYAPPDRLIALASRTTSPSVLHGSHVAATVRGTDR